MGAKGKNVQIFEDVKNWQSIEMKSVIYVKVNQAGKINWICENFFYIL